MSNRYSISPEIYRWACERAGKDLEEVAEAPRFKKLPEWASGEAQPTMKQLRVFARALYVPFGFLFLSEPPDESMPIPDFRTLGGRKMERPSPNLLDTIYACKRRQSWYSEYAQMDEISAVPFVGSATLRDRVQDVAANMASTLGFNVADRPRFQGDALRLLIDQAEEAGVLVMVSGIVGSNTHRPLDIEEFLGFALGDDKHAPLAFINNKDTKAGQIFTLAHGLAHLWLGSTALTEADIKSHKNSHREEVWCNKVAAEFLVPQKELKSAVQQYKAIKQHEVDHLSDRFKVGTLVILRRLLDVGALSQSKFDRMWKSESQRLRKHASASSSTNGFGDFYRTTLTRVGHRFARAIIVSVLGGETLYRDAFRLLGVKKTATFNQLGRNVEVIE